MSIINNINIIYLKVNEVINILKDIALERLQLFH